MKIGIDVGGTNLKAGVVDGGRIVSACRMPLGTYHGQEDFAGKLVSLVRRAAGEAGVAPEAVESVGIGVPGAVAGGKVLYTCNIPMQDVPLEALFRRDLDVPVFLGNDADCAAVGEYFFGAGRGTRNFVTVTLGTGIGGGLILGGHLYTGAGAAGEVGHMVIEQGGILCNCGRRGCWERYASATGLIALTRSALTAHPDSAMHESVRRSGTVDGRTAFDAAALGDAAALEVCRRYVELLAAGITNLVNILQPERIALGGGVAGAPEALLLEPLRALVAAEAYSHHGGGRTEIVKAELGNDAGILGAACLKDAI